MGCKAYIGIGTNIGDRKKNLVDALELIKENEKTIVKRISSIYETAPVGYTEQDAFLNIVVEIETELEPLHLLELTSSIENTMGRKRLIHWGPRVIDLDILIYSGKKVNDERLSIPHPRIQERAFVLIPLMEIAPEMLLNEVPIETYLQNIKDQEVKLWSENL